MRKLVVQFELGDVIYRSHVDHNGKIVEAVKKEAIMTSAFEELENWKQFNADLAEVLSIVHETDLQKYLSNPYHDLAKIEEELKIEDEKNGKKS